MTTSTLESNTVNSDDKKCVAPLGARHLQCFMFCLAIAIAYGNQICISIIIVAMEKEQKGGDELTSQTIGIILSSFFVGYTLIQIPLGYLAGIWSANIILVISAFIGGLGSVLCPVAFDESGWISLCVCRFIVGLCQAGIFPCIHTLLAKWVPPNERGLLATLSYSGIDMGVIIAYPISGVLIDAVGWRSVFYVFGVASILFSLILFVIGSDSPAASSEKSFCGISETERKYIEGSFGVSEEEQTDNDENSKTPWRAILTSGPFWALFIVHCTDHWGFTMLLTEIPIYLAGVLKFDIEENGVKSGLPYLALFLGTLLTSRLSDWSEKRGLSRGLVRKVFNTIGHWGPAAAVVAICFVPPGDTTLPVILLILSVGLNAGANCAYQINHMDLSPKYAGLLVSITNTAASIVSLITPLIVGQIVTDTTNAHQWQIVFYITGVIYFIGNLIFIIFGSGKTQWWDK